MPPRKSPKQPQLNVELFFGLFKASGTGHLAVIAVAVVALTLILVRAIGVW
jgi:hypothetical protein